MEKIVSKISLDMMKPGSVPLIHAVQGECNTRIVELSLTCEGEAWQIPENTILAVRYGKPDQTGGYYDTLPDGTRACSCVGNVVTITLAPQMFSAAGFVNAQLEMLQEDQLLATFSFHLQVEANPAAGVLVSQTYINWLQWLNDGLESRTKEILENGEFTGPMGPAPSVVSQVTEYQGSENPAAIPEGLWTSTIPEVPSGGYLWTRTTVQFETGSAVIYGVTRYGISGTDGKSPVLGEDYFTEDDKTELVNRVLEAIPAAEGVSY